MALVPALTAFCESLGTQTGAQVSLGRPDDAATGIYVWPWKLDADTVMRNPPSRRGPEASKAVSTTVRVVHALVLVRPALTPGGLALLETAQQAILDQPLLNAAGRRVEIELEELPHLEFAALFSAAGLPLTICLSVVLRESIPN